jgi:hypothetical protein
MMPHARARCQPIPATRRQNSAVIPATEGVPTLGFTLVQEERQQWVTSTSSRRVRCPEDFLKAVHFMVGSGYCPGAGKTTIRVAEDIAARMPGSKDGTVAYCLDSMVKRLGLSRSCIAQHVGYLRALGLLVWLERGSARRNALRTRHGDGFGPGVGFKRTATIYAPVAPPVWDQAHGRRIDGDGYGARVVGVTADGRVLAVAEAQAKQAKRSTPKPVDNSGSWTPSVQVPKPRTTARVGGGKKDTARKRAGAEKTPHQPKNPTGWSPQQAAGAMWQARQVQLHTWWTQGSCVRRLAYALRPLFVAGWSWEETARELARWNVQRRPRNVGAYLSAELRRQANSGHIILPDGSVRPYRQAPADENRWDGWLAKRPAKFAARWEETQHLREKVRALTPPGRGSVRRIPRGLQGARPDRVLLTSEEIDRLTSGSSAPRACADLWAEAEERAAARVEAEQRMEHWELLPPGALEYRQVYA